MDQGSSSNNIFDFNSQAGVMSLLASIRSSTLSPADKNELRDLVFLYTNGGGDVSVRIALEQKLITYKIQPTASRSASFAPAPVLPFGSSRPAPVFNTPANQSPVVAAPVAPVFVAEPIPVQQAPTPIPAPTPLAPAAAVPVAPTPVPVFVATPAPAPVAPQAFVPPVAPVTPPPTPVTVPVPVQVPVVSQVSTPLPPVSATGVNYLDRIREIKMAVNSKVGNPVNLVDINNEVGREYMSALLEAMKSLSGGAAGQLEFAMQRLETAYQSVEVAVAAHHNQAGAATAAVAPQAVAEPLPTSPIPQVAASQPVFAPVADVATATTGFAASPAPAPAAAEPAMLPKEEEPLSGFAAMAEPVSSGFNPVAAQAASLASEQKVHTPQDLPSPSSIATSPSGDPYKTREIDSGLEQLLSDWTLFKKSGLFGTGPHGTEHPLFKKLAGLQIPLVLAGRFEGSTQDIKQSITDYMNGWRYEQGIIYEQGETFEHYLRRVIKQILDLQKKRKPA